MEKINSTEKVKNKITAHSLRHTYGCAVTISKGVDAAQAELGHVSSDTTKLYLKHIADDERFKNRADLDGFFGV